MTSHTTEPAPQTGHPAIDAALAQVRLDGPVGEHAEGYTQAQAVLQQVLNPTAEPPAR